MRSWLLLAVIFVVNGASAQSYVVTDLGVGGYASVATALNENGQVVGYYRTSLDSANRAFLWQNGQVTVLSPVSSQALDVNNGGDIVGQALDQSIGQTRAVYWDQLAPTFLPLPTLPYITGSTAVAINDAGEMAGTIWHFAQQPEGGYRYVGLTIRWPSQFSYRLSNFYQFLNTISAGIGEQGRLVGHNETRLRDTHAFYWQGDAVVDLYVGSRWSHAEAINRYEVIVGSYRFGDYMRAFRWTSENMIDIGGLPGGQNHQAYAINDYGLIIGETEFAGGLIEPFLWQDGQALALNGLISSQSGWRLVSAREINNRGQIVGYGYHDGRAAAYLASPVPEPTSLAVIAIGLLCLRRRARF